MSLLHWQSLIKVWSGKCTLKNKKKQFLGHVIEEKSKHQQIFRDKRAENKRINNHNYIYYIIAYYIINYIITYKYPVFIDVLENKNK
jgi:hypothetical protein